MNGGDFHEAVEEFAKREETDDEDDGVHVSDSNGGNENGYFDSCQQ